jgi:hypothetical protein
LQRRLRIRLNDEFPLFGEVCFHVVVWSVLCEVIGPHIMRVTGDVWDAVAYTCGGLVACAWWRFRAQAPLAGS